MIKKFSLARLSLFLFFIFSELSMLFAQAVPMVVSLGYVPHVQFAPFYLGIKRGYFARENLDIKLQYTDSIDALTMLDQGRVDLALVDSDQLILARSNKLRVFGLFQYYDQLPISIFTLNPSIKSPADLKGKKIGVPDLAGTSHLALLLFLKKFGLTNSVEILRIGYQQIPLLRTKRIDAAVGYTNNEPIFLEQEGTVVKQWRSPEFADGFPGAVIAGNSKNLAQKRGILEAFKRAMSRSMDDIKGNPAETFQEIAEYLEISKSQAPMALAALKSTATLFPADPNPSMDTYNKAIQTMRDLGILKADIKTSDLILSPSYYENK